MSTQFSAQLRAPKYGSGLWAIFAARPAEWLRFLGVVFVGSAFVAACAHMALPLYFTPVPLSLAPFAVLVLGLILRPELAGATLCAYLAEGALGLPVFSATPAIPGMAHLLGPTGGYLLSYPMAAVLIAFLVRREGLGWRPGFVRSALSAAVGSLVILGCGAVWLALLTHGTFQSVFNLAVLPFLPGDVLKVIFAAAVSDGWMRVRRRVV